MKPTRHVSVLFKTHLDIGFTDFAADVVRRYVEDFIPGALTLARETRERPERFVWTTGSWLIAHFLENAPAAQRRRMEEAIAAGDFHWHALPFTTHTELMDESLFAHGLSYRDWLDARFGRVTRAAKMTDVPGHTKAMVPLLAKAGVRLLHIGVNPASTVPKVPPVFRWRVGGEEIAVIYDKVYGSTNLLPDGWAVSVNLTNDNLGPPSRREVAKTYAKLHAKFPQATLVPGNLTEVADQLWQHRAELPVLTEEIGDTWIHGLGTDPAKVAQFRALSRLRRTFLDEGKLSAAADRAFGGNLLLVAEHTWGLDVKTHLKDFRTYRREALLRALRKPGFRKMEASWKEQRGYLVRAVEGLPGPLRKRARAELAAIAPRRPRLGEWQAVNADQKVTLSGGSLRFDPTTGAIIEVTYGGKTRLKTPASLAALAYQTFSREDFQRFYRQYNTNDVLWARRDFTKVGLPASALSAWQVPKLRMLRQHRSEDAVLAELEFSEEARQLGAPRTVFLRCDLREKELDLELQWFGKAADRRPEALWLGFAPKLAKGATWTVEKLGQAIATRDVVSRGARSLHASTGPIATTGFSVTSPDAVLTAIGEPKLTNFDDRLPPPASAIHFNLWNNIWNTNFPQWYSDDARFCFGVRWA